MRINSKAIPLLGLLACLSVLGASPSPARAQSGVAFGSIGPINASMGGAAVAAPIDSIGALYWNPATIGALERSEMEFGTGILIPRSTISSFVPAGSLGNGLPARTMGGTTNGDNGVFLLPSVGLVYIPKDSPWTYGLGVYEIGGTAANYPVSPGNPVLGPAPPFGIGVGPLYSNLQLYQFSPSVALRLTDRWSVGVQANIDTGYLALNPAVTSPPTLVSTALGPVPVYASGTQGRFRAGGGFQLGVYYEPNENWSFGASFKSPQWFETYRFHAASPANGRPVSPSFDLDFPLIGSVGFAYKGIERLLWATDFRILDYRDTNGFRHGGFDDRTGVLRGLGWQNIFALGTGVQYQWSDSLTVRAGYTFNLNPVGPAMTSFNLGSPLLIQHGVAIGASYNVTEAFKVSLTYAHEFENAISGPLVQPFVGQIPGASVRTSACADVVFLGATVSF